MSYIIKGILNRQLPWGLVLLGVMIAMVLEMSGVPSLAFAVGVYLPLVLVEPDLHRRHGPLAGRSLRAARSTAARNLTEEQLTAEGDKSPGVLMASGYIAGGAIAGILIAFMAGVTADFTDRITRWSTANNPFFEGPRADLLVADSVRAADRAAVSRRTRARSCTKDTAGSPHLAQILTFDFCAGAADGRGPRRGAARP